jgi:serine/threonine protein phosphatase PrpC
MLSQEQYRSEVLSYREQENKENEDFYAGCTANVIVIKDGTLYCSNAGDSRCCVGNNGQLVKMSKDHKPDDPLEKQRITEAGGFVSEGRVNSNLNLSRALGDLEYKKDKTRPADK